MTVIFDLTIQHPGWRTGTFATAGWDDFSLPAPPGMAPQSYYAEVIQGGPLDLAINLMEDEAHGVGTPIFNVNTSGPLSGTTGSFVTTGYTRLAVYTRHPAPFTVRVLVSDQPTTSAPSSTYCQYGTRLIANVGGNVILTAGVLTAVLARFGPAGATLATLVDSFVGRVLYTNALCGSPPPAMPTFEQSDWLTGEPGLPALGSLGKFWQGMQAAAWPYFCECIPDPGGIITPTIYPDPAITVPPNAPLPPGPYVCDNTDLCSMFDQLLRLLGVLSSQVSQLRSDVTLIQRQHVPFAYVAGTLHSGLSGSGTLNVQGILGLSVQTTTIPVWLSSDMVPVQSWFRLGELSWGTADGWQARHIVTHNPHLFLEVPADVTRVAYHFGDGVVANILELVREP